MTKIATDIIEARIIIEDLFPRARVQTVDTIVSDYVQLRRNGFSHHNAIDEVISDNYGGRS